jgi:hypothetical protein
VRWLLRCPDAPAFDRLLRYEASLERSFDRTLGQLERLQRMRLGHDNAVRAETSSRLKLQNELS